MHCRLYHKLSLMNWPQQQVVNSYAKVFVSGTGWRVISPLSGVDFLLLIGLCLEYNILVLRFNVVTKWSESVRPFNKDIWYRFRGVGNVKIQKTWNYLSKVKWLQVVFPDGEWENKVDHETSGKLKSPTLLVSQKWLIEENTLWYKGWLRGYVRTAAN